MVKKNKSYHKTNWKCCNSIR